MSVQPLLTVDGEVERPLALSFSDLSAIDERRQVRDVSRLDPKRQGDAVELEGLLELAQPKAAARFLNLHSSRDDFHASIPLDAVRGRAILIYRLNGGPLGEKMGGPLRFYIPDFAACHSAEIDECANVKFVDRIEFSTTPGHDNRPHDADQHAALHERETEG